MPSFAASGLTTAGVGAGVDCIVASCASLVAAVSLDTAGSVCAFASVAIAACLAGTQAVVKQPMSKRNASAKHSIFALKLLWFFINTPLIRCSMANFDF